MKPGAPFLGLDIGFKRTGVALSESGLVAQPLQLITSEYPHLGPLLEGVVQLVEQYQVATLVVGIPNNLDDTATPQAERISAVVEKLKHQLSASPRTPEIVLFNEFRSTALGKQRYPNLDDNIAAATVLLNTYLEELA